MDWQNVPNPDDIIDIGKKKFLNYGKYIPWIILDLIVIMGRLPSLKNWYNL